MSHSHTEKDRPVTFDMFERGIVWICFVCSYSCLLCPCCFLCVCVCVHGREWAVVILLCGFVCSSAAFGRNFLFCNVMMLEDGRGKLFSE